MRTGAAAPIARTKYIPPYTYMHRVVRGRGNGNVGWGELELAKMKIKGELLRGGGQSTRTRAPWSPACRLPVAGRFSVDFA